MPRRPPLRSPTTATNRSSRRCRPGWHPSPRDEATLYLVLLDDQVDTPAGQRPMAVPAAGLGAAWPRSTACSTGSPSAVPPIRPPPPSDDPDTYKLIVNTDASNLGNVTTTPNDFTAPLIGTYDQANQDVPYFTGSPAALDALAPRPAERGPRPLRPTRPGRRRGAHPGVERDVAGGQPRTGHPGGGPLGVPRTCRRPRRLRAPSR